MRTIQLAVCLALVSLAFVPAASACCIHTTRQVAWAEYARVGDDTFCAVVSAPQPVNDDGCALAVEPGTAFGLAVVDGAVPAVSFAWDACGATGGAVGSAWVEVPNDCESVRVALGPEATTGVLKQLV